MAEASRSICCRLGTSVPRFSVFKGCTEALMTWSLEGRVTWKSSPGRQLSSPACSSSWYAQDETGNRKQVIWKRLDISAALRSIIVEKTNLKTRAGRQSCPPAQQILNAADRPFTPTHSFLCHNVRRTSFWAGQENIQTDRRICGTEGNSVFFYWSKSFHCTSVLRKCRFPKDWHPWFERCQHLRRWKLQPNLFWWWDHWSALVPTWISRWLIRGELALQAFPQSKGRLLSLIRLSATSRLVRNPPFQQT